MKARWVLPALVMLAGTARAAVAQQEAGGGGTLTIGRLQYDGGGDWYANPSSLPNLLGAVRQHTTLPVQEREIVVRLGDDRLWDVPYLYLTGHGNVSLSPAELERLRRYLERGGFLHVDDNYGLDASIRPVLERLFPGQALTEVPLDHPVYRIVFPFPAGIPKIHEHDGKPAQGFGLWYQGRLVVYYSYESDLGDGWEDPEVHRDPAEVREHALRMGVNLFTYALTSGS